MISTRKCAHADAVVIDDKSLRRYWEILGNARASLLRRNVSVDEPSLLVGRTNGERQRLTLEPLVADRNERTRRISYVMMTVGSEPHAMVEIQLATDLNFPVYCRSVGLDEDAEAALFADVRREVRNTSVWYSVLAKPRAWISSLLERSRLVLTLFVLGGLSLGLLCAYALVHAIWVAFAASTTSSQVAGGLPAQSQPLAEPRDIQDFLPLWALPWIRIAIGIVLALSYDRLFPRVVFLIGDEVSSNSNITYLRRTVVVLAIGAFIMPSLVSLLRALLTTDY